MSDEEKTVQRCQFRFQNANCCCQSSNKNNVQISLVRNRKKELLLYLLETSQPTSMRIKKYGFQGFERNVSLDQSQNYYTRSYFVHFQFILTEKVKKLKISSLYFQWMYHPIYGFTITDNTFIFRSSRNFISFISIASNVTGDASGQIQIQPTIQTWRISSDLHKIS